MKLWGKILHEEGVLFEAGFNTPDEAMAYVKGARDMAEAIDPNNEHELSAEVGEAEAKEAGE